jgi:hypothetical protein
MDTDFVPEPSFLVRTLGYFRDPQVAFVGTPQIYGNTEHSLVARGAAEQLHNFYGPMLQGLSGIGMSLMVGANHVVRVAALKNVDHYAAHITEDLITGMKLHANGWKSVYVPLALAVGEGPFTWEAYFNQQMRWAYGCFDILFRHSPKLLRKMSLRWKLHYFFLMQHYFSGLSMALSTALLGLYFAFGIRAANVDLPKFMVIYSFAILSIWLASLWLQRFHISWQDESHLYLAGTIINIAAWPIYFLAFVTALFRHRLTYKVTPKGNNGEPSKTPLGLFLPHLVFGGIAVAGLASSFFTHRQSTIMIFWALSSAVLMFSVPFFETIVSCASRMYASLDVFGRRLYRGLSPSAGMPSVNHELPGSTSKPDDQVSGAPSVTLAAGKLSSQTKEKLLDCLFLGSAVFASMILYVEQLGFYSDDWSFIGNFTTSANQSLVGLIQTATTPNTLMRPMQNSYDALLFLLFGLHPLGYQLVNGVVFLAIVILFYLVLRRLNLFRSLAVAVPLMFALLPNYATDRFWYAAFQVNLSLLLYLTSLYCGLRAIAGDTKRVITWKAVSLVSLLLSVLSYEVVLPLTLVNLLLYLSPHRGSSDKGRKRSPSQAAFIALNLIVFAYLIIFKAATTTRLGKLNLPGDVERVVLSTIHTNFGTWGVGLPHIWAESMSRHSSPATLFVAAALGVAIWAYLYYLLSRPPRVLLRRAYLRNLAISGFAIFLAGYAIFYTNNKIGFSPTGIDNRVAIVAALGVACTFVGGIGWLIRFIPSERTFRFLFSILIAVVCTGGFLAIDTMASYWIDAGKKQQAVLTDIRNYFPELPSGSTLILDGVCPYSGPGIVFESQWDLVGALQAYYHDGTLRADIVTPRLQVKHDAIYTQIYTFQARYPYHYPMYIYNFKNKGIYLIRDSDSANDYFQRFNPDHDNDCPPASAGNEVDIF